MLARGGKWKRGKSSWKRGKFRTTGQRALTRGYHKLAKTLLFKKDGGGLTGGASL